MSNWPTFDDAFRSAEDAAIETAKEVFDRTEPPTFESFGTLRIFTADIEDNCEQLWRQVQILGSVGIPCMHHPKAGPVPIGLREFLPNSNLYNWSGDLLTFQTSMGLYADEFRCELMDRETVRHGFAHNLGGFIKTRLIHTLIGGLGTQNPPLRVEVWSPTSGARVLASPAYFLNFIVFGGPTSPAIGYLNPGRYLFKVSTPRGRPKIDGGQFDIPPDFDPDLQV